MSVDRVRQLYIVIINHMMQFLILLYRRKSMPPHKHYGIFNKFYRMWANFSQCIDKGNSVKKKKKNLDLGLEVAV